MNTPSILTLAGLAAAILTTYPTQDKQAKKDAPMELGNFSVSLTVKDIKASMAFYEKLDFKKVNGDIEQNWVVLQNGTTTVGLFHGMFAKNMLTLIPAGTRRRRR